MRINSIYYYGLCRAVFDTTPESRFDTQLLNVEYGTDYYTYEWIKAHFISPGQWPSFEEALKLRSNSLGMKRYLADIKDDDVHVFVVTNPQLESLKNDLKLWGFEKYVVHQSAPFMNRNYPDAGRRLHVVILHFKDYQKMSKFTLGADPELFLVDAAGGYIAACGLIGGTKQQPQPLEIGDGFAVQEDNVAVEYNIPPADSREQFVSNIGRAVSYLSDMVSKKGLAFANTSAVVFPEAQLISPASREFGCDPDYNAWRGGKVNPKPKAADPRLRTCGGHVHVGHNFETAEDIQQFIKYADLYLGVPSVLMDNGDLRKELYGKPGAFRYKPFGCEYRVLSNFWTLNPEYTQWVWDATDKAMDAWQQNKFDIDALGHEIRTVINNNDKIGAENLVNAYQLHIV